MSRRPAREPRFLDIADAAGEAWGQQPNSVAWLTSSIVSIWRRDQPCP